MHTYRDAKSMAKVLAAILRERKIDISHGESLDVVAKQFGLNDWNTLSARIKQTEAADTRRLQALLSWDFVGEHPTEFDYGLDDNALGSGRRAALIRYKGTRPSRYEEAKRVFGTLAQTVSAVPYRGQRLEVCAEIASEGVSHGATIWVRVDRSPGNTLAFDNLKDSPIQGWLFGDNGWTQRKVVIEVPEDGVSMQFGFFLRGTGTVWSRPFALSAADENEPLTGKPYEKSARTPNWLSPTNLDFSKVVDLVP
ncbi:glyoxalase superfamily protein [Rhizobium rhizogenes]|uniref:glyoxalase superfamily protein n=1 Tax=Rhizobium rhizogenes TaxID=359 RepID=UPI00228566BA|nr:glyoxalase superfamily protein [Rhizobium rhizogenes]